MKRTAPPPPVPAPVGSQPPLPEEMLAARNRKARSLVLSALFGWGLVCAGLAAWLGGTESCQWQLAGDTDNVSSYERYLRSFPEGPHASEAKSRLAVTKSRLAARAEAAEKLRGVCSGRGVGETASYATTGAFHPIAVFRLEENRYVDAAADVPTAWTPAVFTAYELVACIGEHKKVVVQTCSYSGGFESWRHQYQMPVVLRASSTAQIVAQRLFTGSEPWDCPVSVTRGSPFNIRNRVGSEVDFDEVRRWLGGHVNPGQGA